MYKGNELYDTNRLVRHGACPHRLCVGGWGSDVLPHRGLAYGEVKINGTNTVSGLADFCCNIGGGAFSVTQTFSHSHVKTGWVVGYGTEGKLATPGWTWKVEGLWMDLGTLDATGVTSAVSLADTFKVSPSTVTGGQVTTHTHFTDGILRGGLNYKFN